MVFFCVFIHLEVQVKSKSIKHMKQTSGGCRSERVASSRCYNSLVIRSELYDRSRLFFSQKGRKVVSLDSQSRLGKSVKGLLVQVKDRLKIIGTCHPVSFRVCPVKIISQSVS
jgi:hypothetical protein